MLTNRPEFHFFDTAAMHLGATPFSAYNTYTVDQVTYLIQDSDAKVMVTEKAFLDTVAGRARRRHAAGDRDRGRRRRRERHADRGRSLEGGDPDFDFEGAWKGVEPDDVLTLIYTSGTTGPPKGVQLTHDNIVFAIGGIEDIIQFPDGGRVISWLPYAHIAERQCSQYLPMVLGFTTTDCPDPRQVMAYMPEVRPDVVLRGAADLGEAQGRAWRPWWPASRTTQKKAGWRRRSRSACRRSRLEQAGEPVPDELAAAYAELDEKVLSKIRETLGFDQIVAVNVGAAPTPAEVLEFFHAIGIPRGRAVGNVRDLRRRRGEPAREDQDRLRGPAHAGL